MKRNKKFPAFIIAFTMILSPLNAFAAEPVNVVSNAAEAVSDVTVPADATAGTAAEPIDAVSYAAEHGYLYTADGNASLSASGETTRAEWAYTFDEWLRYLQPSLTAIGYAPLARDVLFEDIAGHDFYDSVYNLAVRGLTEEDAFLYRPDDNLTRQELSRFMATLLRQLEIGPQFALDADRYLGRFGDRAGILPGYEGDAAFMVYLRLIQSTSDGKFAPERAVTRAEACELLLASEALVREKERNRRVEAFGQDNNLWVARVNGRNISASGFDVEVTVNDAAKAINPHVIIAYTLDTEEVPTADNILSGRFSTQSQRLTEMRRVNTAPDETTYAVRFKGKPLTAYYMYVLLKNGAEYSNLVSYNLSTP